MMDETTALNGTATSKDHDGKQKKGYAPLIVLTALLLGLTFCAGQFRGARTALLNLVVLSVVVPPLLP